MSFVVRAAEPADAPAIVRLIKALADYEKLRHLLENDAERVKETLFAPNPKAFCLLAEFDGQPVGYAIWFYSYSTFVGRHGIYLEDLFVRPEHRGKGIGSAFLKALAARCIAENLLRLEWTVLDWNEPSIGFYRSLGAAELNEWKLFRLEGGALSKLGAGS